MCQPALLLVLQEREKREALARENRDKFAALQANWQAAAALKADEGEARKRGDKPKKGKKRSEALDEGLFEEDGAAGGTTQKITFIPFASSHRGQTGPDNFSWQSFYLVYLGLRGRLQNPVLAVEICTLPGCRAAFI